MVIRQLKIKHFYLQSPSGDHATGDIWRQIPTHGLTKSDHSAGIVITPACDLANQKVETITYLPVISISQWFSTTAALGEFVLQGRELINQLPVKRELAQILAEKSLDLHCLREIVRNLENVSGNSYKMKEQDLARRAICCFDRILQILTLPLSDVSMSQVKLIFGEKKFGDKLRRLVTNSFRTDLHYLPADGEDSSWSVIPKHSVALFRCPLTAPIEFFDLAEDVRIDDWKSAINELRERFPLANAFQERRPLRALRLHPVFLSDLLTRFVSLYVRLGSPDFNCRAVEDVCDSICGDHP